MGKTFDLCEHGQRTQNEKRERENICIDKFVYMYMYVCLQIHELVYECIHALAFVGAYVQYIYVCDA